jgi:hypothetical protein
MKTREKIEAIKFRVDGQSINEISHRLGVSKASVSIWVRNVKLTKYQKVSLEHKKIAPSVIEKRRQTRLTNESYRRQKIVDIAKSKIKSVSNRDLLIIGTVLYWAEGSKTRRGIVEFTNGDPMVIKSMMEFFRKICKVPEKKFRGYIHLHPHLSSKIAEKYWSKVSGIPLQQFYKTYKNQNRSSKNKRDSLPYGTFGIYVCDTKLFLNIKGWIEKIGALTTSGNLIQ